MLQAPCHKLQGPNASITQLQKNYDPVSIQSNHPEMMIILAK